MKLVIVESPAKARTIQQYVGKNFLVKSSFGHVRDLPKSTMGVDTDHEFTPQYIIPPKARSHIKELKAAAKKATEIYFATDEDREGEAIAWHLQQILKVKQEKAKRITFAEITKSAIEHALANPRDIDTSLVHAQQARRILDRLVGYELSPLLWKKIRRGLSAGRVQSVAVRLIAEREGEIEAFKPQEYWTINALLQKNDNQLSAKLTQQNGNVLQKMGIATKEQAQQIIDKLQGAVYTVTRIQKTDRKRIPPPPFTTSTLQQTAFNQLGFSSKKTMLLAQQLYEGIELGSAGAAGLITYMRTDSTHIAQEAITKTHDTIKKLLGSAYALQQARAFTKKAAHAQEAHEAIRPTDPSHTPDKVREYLSLDQHRLYELIWQRTIACQMTEAILSQTTIDISAGHYTFHAVGTTIKFDGFLRILSKQGALKETLLPSVQEGEVLNLEKLEPLQHFTQPPARYSEATLVKALEEAGIGRPSTYAPIIDTIQRREYVVKGIDKRFQPTDTGRLVNSLLTTHFADIVDSAFTATMEEDLDKIAAGTKQWQPVIQAFYKPFHQQIEHATTTLNKKDITEEKLDEYCPRCHGQLVIKLGRFGKFKACSNFPTCTYTEPLGEEKKLQDQASGQLCPRCGKALTLKRGRFGPFLGCSGYPTCTYIKKIEHGTGIACPVCKQGEIVIKRSRKGKMFYGCNRYPECKTAYWNKPTGETCPVCGNPLVAGPKNTSRCSNKECVFTKEATYPITDNTPDE